MTERCADCKHCVVCKHLRFNGAERGEWIYFKICTLFAFEKDGWAITVTDNDNCEAYSKRGAK